MTRHKSYILLLITTLVLFPSNRLAAIPLFGGPSELRSLPALQKEDLKILRKIVRKDLTTKTKGEAISWQSPQTGNSGVVTYLGDRTTSFGECRHIQHMITIKDESKKRKLKGFSCKFEDGKWKFLSKKELVALDAKKNKSS